VAWRTERDGVTVVYSVFLSTITTNNKNNRVISFFDENFFNRIRDPHTKYRL